MLMVETVESIESLVRAEAEAVKAADARIQDWQEQVKVGDCFRQVTSDGLVIFGEVLRTYTLWDRKGFRECRCYSVACPEGEVGDVHVSQIAALIDRKEFEKAKNKIKMQMRKITRLCLNKCKNRVQTR